MDSNLQQIKLLTTSLYDNITFHDISERHFYFGALLETKKKMSRELFSFSHNLKIQ